MLACEVVDLDTKGAAVSVRIKLSPSSASRWLTCTAAPALEATCPEPPTSEYVEEGIAAHALAEIILKGQFGKINPTNAADQTRTFIQSCKWADAAFVAAVEEYTAQVVEMVEGYKNAYIDIEQRLDLSEYVPEGFGIADVSIISGNVLHIIDLKFGKGVPVLAEANDQLMLYALGALWKYRILSDVEIVRMTIMQPRLASTSTYERGAADLLMWATSFVKPRAKEAYEGTGQFVPSASACRWCRAKAICRARAERFPHLRWRDVGL